MMSGTGYRDSTCRSVGMPQPCARNGNPPPAGANRKPASTSASSAAVSAASGPVPVGGPIERRVVVHDHGPVARQLHIELETVGAERQAVIERRQGVLGPQRGAAAMGVDKGARENR